MDFTDNTTEDISSTPIGSDVQDIQKQGPEVSSPPPKRATHKRIDPILAIDSMGKGDNDEIDANDFEDRVIAQTALAKDLGFTAAKKLFLALRSQESGGQDMNAVSPTSVSGQVARGRYQVTDRLAKRYNLDNTNLLHNITMGVDYFDEGYEKAKEFAKDPIERAAVAATYFHGGDGALSNLRKSGDGTLSTTEDAGGKSSGSYAEDVMAKWGQKVRDGQEFVDPTSTTPASPTQASDEVAQAEKGYVMKDVGGVSKVADWTQAPVDSMQIKNPLNSTEKSLYDTKPKAKDIGIDQVRNIWLRTESKTQYPDPATFSNLYRSTLPEPKREAYDQAISLWKSLSGSDPWDSDSTTPENIGLPGNNKLLPDGTIAVKLAVPKFLESLIDTIEANGLDAGEALYRNEAQRRLDVIESETAKQSKLLSDIHSGNLGMVDKSLTALSTGAIAGITGVLNAIKSIDPNSKLASMIDSTQERVDANRREFVAGAMGIAGSILGRTELGAIGIPGWQASNSGIAALMNDYADYLHQVNQVRTADSDARFKASGAGDYYWNLPIGARGVKLGDVKINPFELGVTAGTLSADLPEMVLAAMGGPAGLYAYSLYNGLIRGQSISDAGGHAIMSGALMELAPALHKLPFYLRPIASSQLFGAPGAISEWQQRRDSWNSLPESERSKYPEPKFDWNAYTRDSITGAVFQITDVLPHGSYDFFDRVREFNSTKLPFSSRPTLLGLPVEGRSLTHDLYLSHTNPTQKLLPPASPSALATSLSGIESMERLSNLSDENLLDISSKIVSGEITHEDLNSTSELYERSLKGYVEAIRKWSGSATIKGIGQQDEIQSRLKELSKVFTDAINRIKPLQREMAKAESASVNNLSTLTGMRNEAISIMTDLRTGLQGVKFDLENLGKEKSIGKARISDVKSSETPGEVTSESSSTIPSDTLDVQSQKDLALGAVENAKLISDPQSTSPRLINVARVAEPDGTIGRVGIWINPDGTSQSLSLTPEAADTFTAKLIHAGETIRNYREGNSNLTAEDVAKALSDTNPDDTWINLQKLSNELDLLERDQASLSNLTPEERSADRADLDKYKLRDDEPEFITRMRRIQRRNLSTLNSNPIGGVLASGIVAGYDIYRAVKDIGQGAREWYIGMMKEIQAGSVHKSLEGFLPDMWEKMEFIHNTKVRDENGPMPVFHATDKGFKDFSLEHVGSRYDLGWYGAGIYFGEHPVADGYMPYVEGNMRKVYLDIRNPLLWRRYHDGTMTGWIEGIRVEDGEVRFNSSQSLPKEIRGAAEDMVRDYVKTIDRFKPGSEANNFLKLKKAYDDSYAKFVKLNDEYEAMRDTVRTLETAAEEYGTFIDPERIARAKKELADIYEEKNSAQQEYKILFKEYGDIEYSGYSSSTSLTHNEQRSVAIGITTVIKNAGYDGVFAGESLSDVAEYIALHPSQIIPYWSGFTPRDTFSRLYGSDPSLHSSPRAIDPEAPQTFSIPDPTNPLDLPEPPISYAPYLQSPSDILPPVFGAGFPAISFSGVANLGKAFTSARRSLSDKLNQNMNHLKALSPEAFGALLSAVSSVPGVRLALSSFSDSADKLLKLNNSGVKDWEDYITQDRLEGRRASYLRNAALVDELSDSDLVLAFTNKGSQDWYRILRAMNQRRPDLIEKPSEILTEMQKAAFSGDFSGVRANIKKQFIMGASNIINVWDDAKHNGESYWDYAKRPEVIATNGLYGSGLGDMLRRAFVNTDAVPSNDLGPSGLYWPLISKAQAERLKGNKPPGFIESVKDAQGKRVGVRINLPFRAPDKSGAAIEVSSNTIGMPETTPTGTSERKAGFLSLGNKAPAQKPSSPANYFATGLAEEGYSTSIDAITKTMIHQVRRGDVAGLHDIFIQHGVFTPDIPTKDLDGNETRPDFDPNTQIKVDAGPRRTYPTKRYIGQYQLNQKAFGTINVTRDYPAYATDTYTKPSPQVIVDKAIWKEVAPLFDSARVLSDTEVSNMIGKITHSSLIGLMEPTYHTWNVVKSAAGVVPYAPVELMSNDHVFGQSLNTLFTLAVNLPNPLSMVAGNIPIPGIRGAALMVGNLVDPKLWYTTVRMLQTRLYEDHSKFQAALGEVSDRYSRGEATYAELTRATVDLANKENKIAQAHEISQWLTKMGSVPERMGKTTFSPYIANTTDAELVGPAQWAAFRAVGNLSRKLTGGAKIAEPEDFTLADRTLSTKLSKTIDLSPLIYGFNGIDMRARIVAAQAIRTLAPNMPPAEVFDTMNAFGIYNRYLESQLGQSLKRFGIAPFYSAGQAWVRRGVRETFRPYGLAGNIIANMTPGAAGIPDLAVKLSTVLSEASFMTLVAWGISHKVYRDKWPWEEADSRLLETKLKDEDINNNRITKSLYPDPDKGGYVSFRLSELTRGLNVLGLKSFYDTMNMFQWSPGKNGSHYGAALSMGMGSAVSNLLNVGTSGPLARVLPIATLGITPHFVPSIDSNSGTFSPYFFSPMNKTGFGLDRFPKQVLFAAASINSFGENIADAFDLLPNRGGIHAPAINNLIRTAGLLITNNSFKQYNPQRSAYFMQKGIDKADSNSLKPPKLSRISLEDQANDRIKLKFTK